MEPVQVGKLITGEAQRDAIHVAIMPVTAGQNLLPGSNVMLRGDGKAVFWDREGSLGIVDPFLERGVGEGERFWIFLYPNTVTGMRHHWSHPGIPDSTPKSYPSQIGRGALTDWEMICHTMREEDDYSDMGILADALEDAGKSSQAEECRVTLSRWQSIRKVCELLGLQDALDAIEWLEGYVRVFQAWDYKDNPSHVRTFEQIMEAAVTYLETGDRHYLPFDTPDVAAGNQETFWEKFFTFTGRKPPKNEDGEEEIPSDSFFRCSC